MKIYNVLFESNYENEDVHSEIQSYKDREAAVKNLNKSILDEIEELGYESEEDLPDGILRRDGDDYACIFYENTGSLWRFRATVYERELI